MADQLQKVILGFGGGLATDFGPSFTSAPQNGALIIPWAVAADNLTWELDGGPHKVGGTSRLNTTQIQVGTNTVHGFFDAWYQGTIGSETQKQWANIGTSLYSMDALDGTWDSQLTGLEDSKQPHFFMAKDIGIFSSDSNTDVPQRLPVGLTVANLLGSPPNFAFGTWHQNRAWAAGVASNPSRLYYSASLDPEDWTGAGSGSIDIDPEDGDRLTGIWPHRNELIVFKGPNKLSIHRITGSAPTGSAAFARTPFVKGISAINMNGIGTVGDDVVFASPRGLHSLAATAAFGDYIEAFLSRPILSYYQNNLNHNTLGETWMANWAQKGLAVWTFAKSGGTAKNVILVYDYRFQPGRWSTWGRTTAYLNCHSLAIMQQTRIHRLYAGTTTGFVSRIGDVADQRLDGSTAYTAEFKWPFLNFGSSATMKTAHGGWASMAAKGDYNVTIGWSRDRNAEETAAVNQGGGDTLT